jgi:hypothetical protein
MSEGSHTKEEVFHLAWSKRCNGMSWTEKLNHNLRKFGHHPFTDANSKRERSVQLLNDLNELKKPAVSVTNCNRMSEVS